MGRCNDFFESDLDEPVSQKTCLKIKSSPDFEE